MTDYNGVLYAALSSKVKGIDLPKSPFMPRKFPLGLIKKIGDHNIRNGMFSMTLVNFNNTVTGNFERLPQPIMTNIYLNNAPVDLLANLVVMIMNPLKREPDLKEDPAKKPKIDDKEIKETTDEEVKRPVANPDAPSLLSLSFDLFELIISMAGDRIFTLAQLRSLNRRWKL